MSEVLRNGYKTLTLSFTRRGLILKQAIFERLEDKSQIFSVRFFSLFYYLVVII